MTNYGWKLADGWLLFLTLILFVVLLFIGRYWLINSYSNVWYLCTFKDRLANFKLYMACFSVAYIWLVIRMKGKGFLILVGFNHTCLFLHLFNHAVSSVNNLIRTDTVVMLSKSVVILRLCTSAFFSNMMHCEITNIVFIIISIGNYMCCIINNLSLDVMLLFYMSNICTYVSNVIL